MAEYIISQRYFIGFHIGKKMNMGFVLLNKAHI